MWKVYAMRVTSNALRTVRKDAQLPRTIDIHAVLLLLLLSTQLLTTAVAVGGYQSGSGSTTLLDHTQPHFLPNRSGIVQLFEWQFADIGAECEQFLGPRGYAGVQVSPVAEHLVVRTAAVQQPWWERYQPVSFQIVSRSGSEAEFQQMTRACNAAGVRIYVDVVLNHMAGAYDEETASGRRLLEGYAGSTANASSYEFSAMPFASRHFHKPCGLTNYLDAHVVRNCELNGWPDLNHSRLDVRANLTGFLNRLVDMGVAGFRVDAAKYIWPVDIKLLFNDVKNLNSDEFEFPENARPYVYQDVVDLGVDSISKTEYSSYGMVTEYLYAAELAYIINGKAPLSTLINWGPAMGFLPHQQALVFVDSHDGQRDPTFLGANQLLSYKQPRKYIMATAFMLAHPYGRVKRIMSSYYFATDQPEQGPPLAEGEELQQVEQKTIENTDAEADATAEGEEIEVGVDVAAEEDASPQPHIRAPTFDASTGRCEFASGWVCEHRWPPIVQMLELANTLSELEDGVFNFQTDGLNHVAFCRGNKAFFAFNNDAQLAYDAEVETCLPSGVYCDVITGGRADNAEDGSDCVGKRVVVEAEGKARIMLPAAFGVDEGVAATGSDYGEADEEAKDAYEIAVGVEGEFGVLAIYEGSRLENEVHRVGQEAGGSNERPPVDKVEEATATEVVTADNAEDVEDEEDVTEIAETSNEDESPEELEDAVVEKNAKLEEAATDASVENEGVDGEAPAQDAGEGDGGADADEEEDEGEEALAAVDTEQVEDGEPPAEEDEPAEVGEEPLVDETEPVVEEGEGTADAGENADTGDAEGEIAKSGEADNQADEVVADEPAIAEDPPEVVDTADADETEKAAEVADEADKESGKEGGIIDEAKDVLEEVEKEVTDAAQKVEDEIAQHVGKDGSVLATGINTGAEIVANKTKEIVAKAGFNVNGARTLQRIQLCSLPILISTVLINFYST